MDTNIIIEIRIFGANKMYFHVTFDKMIATKRGELYNI